jgi:hypothetical protein
VDAGKEMGSYYWHGRDNKVTRELNPKVSLQFSTFQKLCKVQISPKDYSGAMVVTVGFLEEFNWAPIS